MQNMCTGWDEKLGSKKQSEDGEALNILYFQIYYAIIKRYKKAKDLRRFQKNSCLRTRTGIERRKVHDRLAEILRVLIETAGICAAAEKSGQYTIKKRLS